MLAARGKACNRNRPATGAFRCAFKRARTESARTRRRHGSGDRVRVRRIGRGRLDQERGDALDDGGDVAPALSGRRGARVADAGVAR
jgi:hypothetical protein